MKQNRFLLRNAFVIVALIMTMIDCAHAESFDVFYKHFRKDVNFQRERTVFPLKRIYFTSDRPSIIDDTTKKYIKKLPDGKVLYPLIEMVEKKDFRYLYPDDVMEGNENEGFKAISPDAYESFVDLKDGTRVLTFRFAKKDDRWYLRECEDSW